MVIDFNKENIIKVPITKVRPNTWNPKEKGTKEYGYVLDSIRKYGQDMPILVREKDGYEILDGEQRYTAMLELGYKEIWVYNKGEVKDAEAEAITIWWQVQVPFNEIKLSEVLKRLVSDNKAEIELPFSDEELKLKVELLDFDWSKYGTLIEVEERDNNETVMVDTDRLKEFKAMAKEFRKEGNEEEVIIIRTKRINVLENQAKVIYSALERVEKEGVKPVGRALEFICADYLSGI